MTTVSWIDAKPGEAAILCTGGSVDDRWLAEVVTREELAACGIRQARFSFDNDGHALWWSPGVAGRGIVESSGRVHSWPEAEGDHHDMASAKGLPWGEVKSRCFITRPDGTTYFPYTNYDYTRGTTQEELMAHAEAADPRLKPKLTQQLFPRQASLPDHDMDHDIWASNDDSKLAASEPLSYFHYSPHQFNPGDTVTPASQLTPEQWAARPEYYRDNAPNLHLLGYDPNKVYTYDHRHFEQPYDLPADFAGWHVYEVEPQGPVEQDAEVAQVRNDWEKRHGHPFEPDANYGYDGSGWHKDTCEECRDEDDQGYQGPEWYHPYAWQAPSAKVIRQLDDDEIDRRYNERRGSVKTAHWDDIMAKAKRLIQSGNVQLLRNGYNVIVAHVIGDHGEYQCEISRDDPDSRAITQWTCECPWDQYAFQRTRQWRKYEGRPCAHVLAAYWVSQSTPLDEDAPPGATPAGPAVPPAPQGMAPMSPFQPKIPVQGQPGPDGGMMPPLPPAAQLEGPPSMGMGSPYPPTGNPPAQPPMVPQFAPPAGNSIIPPYPMDPAQLQLPVSTPGARGGPYPANPMQQPGTFSHVYKVGGASDTFQPDSRARVEEATLGTAAGREGATDAGRWMEIPKGANVEVVYQDPSTGWVEVRYALKGGPMTSYHVECFIEPEKLTPLEGDSPLAPRRRV